MGFRFDIYALDLLDRLLVLDPKKVRERALNPGPRNLRT